MIIDLRSDTVTRPSTAMLEYMMKAELGDDVFREDPTVQLLEQQTAKMFGMEAGLFCPSGTMCNQIAVKVHTRALDEVLCHRLSHLYNYELSGHAFHSGIAMQLIEGNKGFLQPHDVSQNIRADYDWLPVSKLVWIENTCNKAGGTVCTLDDMKAIHKVCIDHDLKLHLDGARIFNALAEINTPPKKLGNLFDSIIDLFIKRLGCARRFRFIGR